jgi:hypothetical protein
MQARRTECWSSAIIHGGSWRNWTSQWTALDLSVTPQMVDGGFPKADDGPGEPWSGWSALAHAEKHGCSRDADDASTGT